MINEGARVCRRRDARAFLLFPCCCCRRSLALSELAAKAAALVGVAAFAAIAAQRQVALPLVSRVIRRPRLPIGGGVQ